ncbi:MAG: metallophosphoesterase family protein [Caldilineaceae bacterium]|nr:metallophosphoesterase family protein [Caldilineaceae bacterium]
MMKIALFSDIHGNSIALDAVLADIAAQGGVDAYWVLGDLVAIGHDPVGVLERLTQLPNVRFVRGNTDRYVFARDRPFPSLADAEADPSLLARLVEVAETFSWTQGALTTCGWLEWLAQLPLEIDEVLPDGTRLLGVHASPGRDDGDGIAPRMHDEEIGDRLQGCRARLICVGHTHQALNHFVGDWHVVNLGSLSNPLTQDRRASYVLLTADETGYQVEHRRIDYDRAAVIEALERQRHPGAAYIIRHLRGGDSQTKGCPS